jgi:hypothetical protein
MDASKIFESVLNCVEESRLNFLLTRTPFSATICLKRSFSKHQSKAVDEKNKVLRDDYIALEGKVKMLETVLNDVKLERSRVEELYKKEKIKVKEAAETEGQFRAELLKIKSEKNAFSSQVKSLQVKCANVEDELKHIQQDNKELVTQLKSKVKSLAIFQSKVEEITNENDCTKIMIENLMSKVKYLTDQPNLSDLCSFCEKTFENRSDLKVHLQDEHFLSQGTQYDVITNTQELVQKESPVKEFLVYKCFYCHRTIISEDQLKSHRKECFTVCAICDAQCRDDIDLQLHMFQYHTWIIPQYLCSQCPTNFKSNETLQSHRKYSHGNK